MKIGNIYRLKDDLTVADDLTRITIPAGNLLRLDRITPPATVHNCEFAVFEKVDFQGFGYDVFINIPVDKCLEKFDELSRQITLDRRSP